MKRSAAAVVAAVALSGCAPTRTPSAPPAAPPPSAAAAVSGNVASPMLANLCAPGRDMGCGTPDAECSTNRLGRRFVHDGVVYTCRSPKPYAWRRD